MGDIDDAAVNEIIEEELKNLPKRKTIPEAVPAESLEPDPAVVDALARGVLVTDSSTFCRHSYVLAVLCLRLERILKQKNAGSSG